MQKHTQKMPSKKAQIYSFFRLSCASNGRKMKPKAGLATKIAKTEEKTFKIIELLEACEDFKKH